MIESSANAIDQVLGSSVLGSCMLRMLLVVMLNRIGKLTTTCCKSSLISNVSEERTRPYPTFSILYPISYLKWFSLVKGKQLWRQFLVYPIPGRAECVLVILLKVYVKFSELLSLPFAYTYNCVYVFDLLCSFLTQFC